MLRTTALLVVLAACQHSDEARIAELEHKVSNLNDQLGSVLSALEGLTRSSKAMGDLITAKNWWCSPIGCARTDAECRMTANDGMRCEPTRLAYCAALTRKPGLSCYPQVDYCKVMTAGQCVESR